MATWPVWPVVAIAGMVTSFYYDDAFSTWDDPDLLWDTALASPVDGTCFVTGLDIATGNPDEHGNFDAGSCSFSLDNRNGEWSQFLPDGSPGRFGPGQALDVWATDGTDSWWLFSGRISRWDETDFDTIDVEAFDLFSDLAQPIGTFTPGVGGELPGARAAAILTSAGRTTAAHRFATGIVTLTAQETEAPPLDELREAIGSDGGVVYVDADGTLVTTDRSWRNAARDDQTSTPMISDNVCTVPMVVWNAVLSTNDIGLADTVVLENIANLRAQAGAALGAYVMSESDQQWTTQLEGDTLAATILGGQQQARVALESFDMYLLDPLQPEMWRAVDWRLLDRFRFLHDSRVVGGTLQRIDVTVLVLAISHAITPNGWVMTVRGSRVQTFHEPAAWDNIFYAWDGLIAAWGF